MKVLCIAEIHSQEVPNGKPDYQLPPVIIGEEYNVIQESTYKDLLFYRLAERVDISGNNRWWYQSTLFAPLSDIDEMELTTESKLQTA